MMGFQATVDLLSQYHCTLWFNASLDAEELRFCDRWICGDIRSGAGRLLAMQAGHPDEWELSFNHKVPDRNYDPDEPDEGELITEQFLADVRLFMTCNVYPDINPQGDFIRDHTPDEQADLSGIFASRG